MSEQDEFDAMMGRKRRDEDIEVLATSVVYEIAKVAEVVDWSRKSAAVEVSKAVIELIEKMIDRKLGR